MGLKVGFFRLLLLVGLLSAAPIAAQDQGKPFDFPVALPPGPSTWLLGQPYGNTTGAFNFGSLWYEAGQRLHFGIDISMPCGTPLVAVADAMVMGVDDLGFGSGPHNLILRHDEYGLTTLYGHLLERPPLVNGQWVTRGQEIGLSGDPDSTCDSRPHLHFEVRSLDYRTAYNPVDYINANWNTLSTIGSFSNVSFQRDLDNARQWLTLSDQPEVVFGGRALNAYVASWPPPAQPPANPPLARELGPLADDSQWQMRRLGYEGCCFYPWWSADNPNRLYTVDGGPGQRASLYEWTLGEGETFTMTGEAPPTGIFTSPDGTHRVTMNDQVATITRLTDGATWSVTTEGAAPAISPDNARLLWTIRRGVQVPGQEPPPLEVWVSSIDGTSAQMVASQRGGSAVWLDAARLLVIASERQVSTLTVYDLSDGSSYTLGQWLRLRSLSVAPGGGRLMFYLTFNGDPAADGVYTLDVRPGATAARLPWFGAWRWRDADSVYYIPFDPTTEVQSLRYYHLPGGTDRAITDPVGQPFTVANGDWSVSADGRRIVFLSAIDLTMWLIEQV